MWKECTVKMNETEMIVAMAAVPTNDGADFAPACPGFCDIKIGASGGKEEIAYNSGCNQKSIN